MEGQYYLENLEGNFTPSDKFKMFIRILSCSEKLKLHVLICGMKEDCKICKKINLFILLFLNFEKNENKEIDISKIMDEEMVQDSFLSDKFVKFFE